MQNPLVSIIIPTYNRAHLIGETLDSVIAQTYSNWECIVVDDGSTDTTDEVLKMYCEKDSRIQYHHRPADRLPGGNAARNYGFELCRGEYINWFDDDDVMLDGFLETKIKILKRGFNFVICSGYSVDEELKNRKVIKLYETSNLFKEYTLWKLKIFLSSVLFKKKFLFRFKLFNEEILRGQETELFSRIFYKITPSKYLIMNKPLFYYRQHLNTKSKINKKYIQQYKYSEAFNSIQNIKRGVELNDKEIINLHYHILIHLYFLGIYNDHKSNSRFVLFNLLKTMRRVDLFLFIKLLLWGNLFILLNRTIYKVERNLKDYFI